MTKISIHTQPQTNPYLYSDRVGLLFLKKTKTNGHKTPSLQSSGTFKRIRLFEDVWEKHANIWQS